MDIGAPAGPLELFGRLELVGAPAGPPFTVLVFPCWFRLQFRNVAPMLLVMTNQPTNHDTDADQEFDANGNPTSEPTNCHHNQLAWTFTNHDGQELTLTVGSQHGVPAVALFTDGAQIVTIPTGLLAELVAHTLNTMTYGKGNTK